MMKVQSKKKPHYCSGLLCLCTNQGWDFFLLCFGNNMILLLWRLFQGLHPCWGLAQKLLYWIFFFFCSGTQMIKRNGAISFIGFAEYTCSSSKNRRPESRLKLATLSDPFSTKRLIQQQQQQHPSLWCRTDFVWKGCAPVAEKCLRSNMKTKYGKVKRLSLAFPSFKWRATVRTLLARRAKRLREKEKALHSKLLYVIAPSS